VNAADSNIFMDVLPKKDCFMAYLRFSFENLKRADESK
jgi:hypothetical protein